MKKIVFLIFLCLILLGIRLVVRADSCSSSDLTCQIDSLGQDIAKLNADLNSQTANYQQLLAQIEDIKAKIIILGNDIRKGEEALIYQKELLNQRVKSYYKNVSGATFSLVDILVSQDLSESLRKFFYQKSLVDEDKNTIIKVVLYIKNLEDQKAKLAALKIQVDEQSKELATKISQTRQKIAELSALQQQLIAEKLASLNIPQSAYVGLGGGCSSDINPYKDPGFGGTKFGLFTYGVPNRVGLNQYGAKGRAEAGQGVESILSAYYQNYTLEKSYNTGINIAVSGTNDYGQSINQTWNIEDYLKHVYEMPTNWSMEALKAQTVAARSYALAATNNGGSPICPNQHCQEVKQEENTDSWKQAVEATKGWVMTNGGNAISAYYSSTHGGYVYDSSSGISNRPWLKNAQDTSSSINNLSDLNNNAYDKSSPWFYCDWGSRSQYNKTAWLTSDEAADIINVLMLVQRDPSTANHLYQVDKSNPAGTDTWDAGRVKQELSNLGIKPFSSISSITTSIDFGQGKTTSVAVSGDSSVSPFNPSDFKNYFNLRAPANIQIVGPLYNAEQR